MKLPNCLLIALPILAILAAPPSAQAQQSYRNVVNQRFRTVGNGPQSALIVDVNDANDRAAVRQAAMQRYSAYLQANLPTIQKEMAFLQAHHLVKPGQPLGLTESVMVRQNGRLVLPKPHGVTRAGNELTFTFPTTGQGAWSASDAQALGTLANTLYTELKTNVLGPPGWNGNVTVLNEDPRLGKVDEVIGALLVVNGGNVEILFPTFTAYETQFLAMAQVMAQAFHGPLRIGYDAWEQGMGRAAAVVAARDLQPQITGAGQSVNPANGFYYTPDYDLLNQPPLGNNTFTPPTKSNQPFSATTLSGMLVPRLQMASTAWLKCFIENPNFFKAFNAAYYPVVIAAPGLANDTPTLRNLAAGVLPNVEMLPFDAWYEQQYVLDTSIIPGPKLYAYTQPTFPTSTTSGDAGMAAFVIYYRTDQGGDEFDLSGTGNVVYWDYTYQNRLSLPSFETVSISNGFGSVSPFFTNIGGDPTLKGTMRVAVDFPVNKEYVRVNFPANETGTEAAPNDFSGVLVGANTGTLSVTYQGGSGQIVTSVAQGAFGIGAQGGKVPNGFSTTKLVYTPPAGSGGQAITYQRNTAFNNTFGVAPVFVLAAPGPTDSIPHTFNTGPQMISLPIRPLNPNMALALGIPSNTALLAQYRQDASGDDKYLRFPSLPLYEPGYSLWSNFSSGVTATIVGERTDIQPSLSIPLQFGWNQIATPYNTNLNVTTDITFQYLGGDVLSLSGAKQRAWVAPGIMAYSATGGYEDITNAPADLPLNALEPWKGYWIRVLVTEGLTITYTNPNGRAAALKGRAAALPTRAAPTSQTNGWRIPLTLQDADGHATGAVFGQAPNGSDSFVASLDVASPPPFTRAATLAVRFPHTDWDTGQTGTGGDFLSDIRRSAASSQWNMVVTVPQPGQTYTVSWANTALLPRGTRLTITDTASGTRQLMNSSSSLIFRTGQGEITRSFTIQVEPHALGRLRINNINAVVPLTRGRGVSSVTIAYEISAAAETQIAIMSGVRTVRHIAPGRAAASGVNQVVWDMRDDQGRILPAGPYSVSITAHTPDGEQTRAIAPLLLTR